MLYPAELRELKRTMQAAKSRPLRANLQGAHKQPGQGFHLDHPEPRCYASGHRFHYLEATAMSPSNLAQTVHPERILLFGILLLVAGCECSDQTVAAPPEDPTPAPSYNRGFFVDMALDSTGQPWLAYQDRDTTALSVAKGSGDPVTFSHETVDGEGEVQGGLLIGNFDGGYYSTIALDAGDVPHVAHWDKEGGRLRYATDSGEGWELTTVDTGNVGQFASIGVRQGDPIIAYYDYGAGSLKVAYVSEGAWSTEVVDAGDGSTTSRCGKYADLLVGDNGTVHIAYQDEAAGVLRVASGTPGNWIAQTWYSTEEGSTGAWPNLSEQGGSLYVSFQDLNPGALLFGRWTGAELDATVVHAGEFIGADSATAWSGDSPTIMYHDGVNNDALLAVNSGTGWNHMIHREDGAHGFHNSLMVGNNGQLNWAAFNHTTTDIEFQRFSLP